MEKLLSTTHLQWNHDETCIGQDGQGVRSGIEDSQRGVEAWSMSNPSDFDHLSKRKLGLNEAFWLLLLWNHGFTI